MFRRKIVFTGILMVLLLLVAACNTATGPVEVGRKAPDFNLLDSDGSQVSLADYKGQPVLLFFHMAGG